MSFGDFVKTVFECNYHILIINLRNFKKTACQNLSLHYKTRKVSVDGVFTSGELKCFKQGWITQTPEHGVLQDTC